MFDDMVAAQVRRLGQAWPELIRPLQFAVEDVPPSDPTPWQTEPNMTSQCFPASHGIPARVVLYRMPLQTEAPTCLLYTSQHRRTTNPHDGPVSIYEVHAGSWRQGLTYRDLAKQLVDYVKQEGFTHVEFMPCLLYTSRCV